jgi:MFS family permease
MTAATDFGGLMAARFLLGSFEASVAPTFIAIVQMWYRRGEQTNRNAAWYSMLGIVNILGSLLTYGLGHIHSKVLFPYQVWHDRHKLLCYRQTDMDRSFFCFAVR